jgi:general secretion pathway protein L
MAASSDAMAARPRAGWRVRLDAFWRWWAGEIGAFTRERFPKWRGVAGVPAVTFEGDVLAVALPGGQPEARIDLAALDALRARAELRSLLQRAGETRDRVRLCMRRDECLVRRVSMPLATEENLEQVLGFEMDRLTPFPAGEVYFDYRVVARDAAGGKLTLLLAVARRALVDARVERLRGLGANVQAVAVPEDLAAGPALDLLPSEKRGERESARDRGIQRMLAGAVVILLGLALVIPVWRKRETVKALLPVVERSRQEAEAANRLRTALESQVDEYNFLLSKKYATYPALAFVEELSRLLPDNTWLQQLELRASGKGREVQVTGETASSSKLIEILEQSKLLRNATPRGTVTRGSTPNSERFMIGAEAVPRAEPEPVPVLQAGRAAPAPPAPASAAPNPVAPSAAGSPAPRRATPATGAGNRPPNAAAPATKPTPAPASGATPK